MFESSAAPKKYRRRTYVRIGAVNRGGQKADMHRVGGTAEGKRQDYASIAGDKLADCQEWLSYLVKARSKPEDIRGIYFSSRDSAHVPCIGPACADSAAKARLHCKLRDGRSVAGRC